MCCIGNVALKAKRPMPWSISALRRRVFAGDSLLIDVPRGIRGPIFQYLRSGRTFATMKSSNLRACLGTSTRRILGPVISMSSEGSRRYGGSETMTLRHAGLSAHGAGIIWSIQDAGADVLDALDRRGYPRWTLDGNAQEQLVKPGHGWKKRRRVATRARCCKSARSVAAGSRRTARSKPESRPTSAPSVSKGAGGAASATKKRGDPTAPDDATGAPPARPPRSPSTRRTIGTR